jgi:hypothetical protein
MMKLVLGLITALMLASCAYPGATMPTEASGAGHPSTGYPGPRVY